MVVSYSLIVVFIDKQKAIEVIKATHVEILLSFPFLETIRVKTIPFMWLNTLS